MPTFDEFNEGLLEAMASSSALCEFDMDDEIEPAEDEAEEVDEELEDVELAAELAAVAVLLRNIRLMLDTLGTLNLSQMPSATSRSLISQAKMPGSLILSSRMNLTTWRRECFG